jgi:hypothetical protein
VVVDMARVDRIAAIGINQFVLAARALGRGRGRLFLLNTAARYRSAREWSPFNSLTVLQLSLTWFSVERNTVAEVVKYYAQAVKAYCVASPMTCPTCSPKLSKQP